jgi:hypothetical protein
MILQALSLGGLVADVLRGDGFQVLSHGGTFTAVLISRTGGCGR